MLTSTRPTSPPTQLTWKASGVVKERAGNDFPISHLWDIARITTVHSQAKSRPLSKSYRASASFSSRPPRQGAWIPMDSKWPVMILA